MGKLFDFLTTPCLIIKKDSEPKVVNKYTTINNYYIHTENRILKVNEIEFKKFIEKKKLEMIENVERR